MENPDDVKEEAIVAAKLTGQSLISDQTIKHAVELLFRLDEEKTEEKEGVFKVLGILENLFEIRPQAVREVSLDSSLLTWISLKVIPSQGAAYLLEQAFNDNILYATEILSILMQESEAQQKFHSLGLNPQFVNFLRTLLELPDTRYPADYVEAILNLFDTACLAVMDTNNQTDFAEAEGIDVMLKLLK